MVLPKWTRLLDRSKRQTFTQTPSDNLDNSIGFIDCNCKAKKQVEKYYRYIRKRLDQLEYDKYRLRSEHDDINSRENQLSKSIWHLRNRERELDDYCAYLSEKRQSIDGIYTKCEALESQINDRFNEYNTMQRDLKKRIDELDQWQNNLTHKEQHIERMTRDLEMREREFSLHQGRFFQERRFSDSRDNVNTKPFQQYMMEIENERRRLDMDRQNFTQYYESIMEEIDRKYRKLNRINDEYRAKEDDIISKEKKLQSNMESIQRAWNDIEEAKSEIIKQRELLKQKVIAAENAAQKSISLQQQLIQQQQQNESERRVRDDVYKETPTRYENRNNQEDQYRMSIKEIPTMDPRLQMQIQEKMSDIAKLVEDIKQETSLIAMEKYSLQGQKKQFELEKEINERELAAKKQHLLNLEQKLRKNDIIDQTTPTTMDGQYNGYYSDKMRIGDSSTRFGDERDFGGFFLDKSTDTYPTTKRINNKSMDSRSEMKDISEYGKIRN